MNSAGRPGKGKFRRPSSVNSARAGGLKVLSAGCFVLPAGVGPSGLIICSGQALSEIDGRVLLFQHSPSMS